MSGDDSHSRESFAANKPDVPGQNDLRNRLEENGEPAFNERVRDVEPTEHKRDQNTCRRELERERIAFVPDP